MPTWQAGQPVSLVALSMMNATSGWGLETRGYILHTTDGGRTWKNVSPSKNFYVKGGFFARTANEAWANSTFCLEIDCLETWDATIWHTLDGGTTWQPSQPICLGGPYPCKYDYVFIVLDWDSIAMQFVNRQTGWLLVNTVHVMMSDHCRLYQTADGGKNWDLLGDSAPIPCGFSVHGLAFLDANTGWMANNLSGKPTDPSPAWGVSVTRDGGYKWKENMLPPPADLPAEFAGKPGWCNTENVSTILPLVVDLEIYCQVEITGTTERNTTPKYHYHSADGGTTWQAWQVTGSVQFIDSDTGWMLVPSTDGSLGLLQRTNDGGRTWMKIKQVIWEKAQFDFVSEQVGWAIVTVSDISALVHSMDGGLTWTEIKPIAVP